MNVTHSSMGLCCIHFTISQSSYSLVLGRAELCGGGGGRSSLKFFPGMGLGGGVTFLIYFLEGGPSGYTQAVGGYQPCLLVHYKLYLLSALPKRRYPYVPISGGGGGPPSTGSLMRMTCLAPDSDTKSSVGRPSAKPVTSSVDSF